MNKGTFNLLSKLFGSYKYTVMTKNLNTTIFFQSTCVDEKIVSTVKERQFVKKLFHYAHLKESVI